MAGASSAPVTVLIRAEKGSMPSEAKVLREWLRGLDASSRPESMAIRAFTLAVKALMFILFLIVFFLGRLIVGWWLVAILVAAMVLGAAQLVVIIRRQSKARLPFLVPHLNVQSMRARLAQLEA